MSGPECRCGDPASWGIEQRQRVRRRDADGEFRTEKVWISLLVDPDRAKFCRFHAEEEARRRNDR